MLKTAFSLTEGRIRYDLARRDGTTASDLARDLGIDNGYLSRVLAKFEAGRLLSRTPSASDGRQVVLQLTGKGRKAFAPLNRASQEQTGAMLAPLKSSDRGGLGRSMHIIQKLLGGAAEPTAPYVLRDLQSGDIGWIVHRQGILYAQEHGWDETFEALVAEIAGAFLKNANPKTERCWIAERQGEIAGSV